MAERYSKIYHKLMAEYPEVWASDRSLALFVRLLCDANAFYPQFPRILRHSKTFQSLVRSGLVIEKPGNRYSIRGLEAERERKSHASRIAAASRWEMPNRLDKNKEGNGDATASLKPSFMRFPEPDRAPGEAVVPRHDGRHGKSCLVCFPVAR